MSLKESLQVAWAGLTANKLRSALTMLGVIIGVGAVIAMVAIGQGSSRQVTERIKSLGANVITISARPQTRGKLLLDDTKDLLRRVPTLRRAVPSISTQVTAKWRDQTYQTTMEGTAPGYTSVREFHTQSGRFLSQDDLDHRRKVAVIGQEVENDLFAGHNPLGETILLNGEQFTVVGLMEEKGEGVGGNFDDRILVPVTTAQRLMLTDRIGVIYAQADSSADAAPTVTRIQAIYQTKFPTRNPGVDDVILVRSQDQLLQTISDTTNTFTLMLGGIAGVSLLVGGIGIMNIMLVSVTERTREIGIRKALGARPNDILSQFLTEAVILSLTGGMIGVIAGVGGAWAADRLGVAAAVSVLPVSVAFTFSAAVGLFFGIYPALKAADLDPIEALRYE